MKQLIVLLSICFYISCKKEQSPPVVSPENQAIEIDVELLADLFIMEAHAEVNETENLEVALEEYYKKLASLHNMSVQDIKDEVQKVEKNPEAFSRVISRLMDIRNEGYRND